MTQLRCPALRNDDTLGFLAALGLLELTTELAVDARLGWDSRDGTATLHSNISTLDDLVDRIHNLARHLDTQDRVVPAPFPELLLRRQPNPARATKKPQPVDPMRMTPAAVLDHYRTCAQREADGDRQSGRWLVALVSQLAVDSTGVARLHPLLPRANQMTAHQQYATHLHAVADNRGLLREALIGWRRYGHQDDPPPTRKTRPGSYLDHRALRDAITTGHGQPQNASVPGATWLALMSLPLFPQADDGAARAVGWAATKQLTTFRWPIWTKPLDLWAVTALLSHPLVARPYRGDLAALGIVAIATTNRRRLPKQLGALGRPAVTSVGGG